MNEEKIFDQLRAVIDEHLPSVIASQLKSRIIKVEELEIVNETLNQKLQSLHNLLDRHKELDERESDLDKRKKELDQKEKKIIERELRQEINDLKVKHAEQRICDHTQMINLIFKGPIYHRSIRESGTVPCHTGEYGTTVNIEKTTDIFEESE